MKSETNTPLARKFTLFLLLALLAVALMGSIVGMYYLFFDIFAPTMIVFAIILLPLFLLGLGWVLKKDSPVSAKRDS